MIGRLLTIAFAVLSTALTQANSRADLIMTFDVSVRESEIRLGEQVTWDVFVTVANDPAADLTSDNFGIAAASFTLQDSQGDILRLAALEDNDFPGYFKSPGELEDGRLIEVGVVLFVQNDGAVRGADSDNVDGSGLGRFFLASGSYVPTVEGQHSLIASDFSSTPEQYFTAAGQFIDGGTRPYEQVQFGRAEFRVSAVPEPGALGVLGLSALMLLPRRRKK